MVGGGGGGGGGAPDGSPPPHPVRKILYETGGGGGGGGGGGEERKDWLVFLVYRPALSGRLGWGRVYFGLWTGLEVNGEQYTRQ